MSEIQHQCLLLQRLALPLVQCVDYVPHLQLLLHLHVAAIAPLLLCAHEVFSPVVGEFLYVASSFHATEIYDDTHHIETVDYLCV